VVEPATGEVLERIGVATPDDVSTTAEHAATAFTETRWITARSTQAAYPL
jgi:hypothetical protein